MEYKLELTKETKHKKKKIKELFKAVEKEAKLKEEELKVLKVVKRFVIVLTELV